MNAKRWIHILGRDKEKQPGPGVRDEPKSRGKFYRIFKTCFDLQMRARWHKDEIVNVRTWMLEGRDGPLRYRGLEKGCHNGGCTRRKSLDFIAGLKGLQSNA